MPHTFSSEEWDPAAGSDSNGVPLKEVDCNGSKYSGGTASGPDSSDILRYSEGCRFFAFSVLALLLMRSQHSVPIARTNPVIETVIPITTEGLLAADEARLLREGAACIAGERTAKPMGAILTA